jgi:hypothetical protein
MILLTNSISYPNPRVNRKQAVISPQKRHGNLQSAFRQPPINHFLIGHQDADITRDEAAADLVADVLYCSDFIHFNCTLPIIRV